MLRNHPLGLSWDHPIRSLEPRYTRRTYTDDVFGALTEPSQLSSIKEVLTAGSDVPDLDEIDLFTANLLSFLSEACQDHRTKGLMDTWYGAHISGLCGHLLKSPGFRIGVQDFPSWTIIDKEFDLDPARYPEARDFPLLDLPEDQLRKLRYYARCSRATATYLNGVFTDFLRARALAEGRKSIDLLPVEDGNPLGVQYSFTVGDTYVTARNCTFLDATESAYSRGCRKVAMLGCGFSKGEIDRHADIFPDLTWEEENKRYRRPGFSVLQFEFQAVEDMAKACDFRGARRDRFVAI